MCTIFIHISQFLYTFADTTCFFQYLTLKGIKLIFIILNSTTGK